MKTIAKRETTLLKEYDKHFGENGLSEQIDLESLQTENRIWAEYNFPEKSIENPVLGVSEEVGELSLAIMGLVESSGRLSHSVLKRKQNICGTNEQHLNDARNAVGDIVVFLSDVCNQLNFSLAKCVSDAWSEVRLRDFQNNRATGKPESA